MCGLTAIDSDLPISGSVLVIVNRLPFTNKERGSREREIHLLLSISALAFSTLSYLFYYNELELRCHN